MLNQEPVTGAEPGIFDWRVQTLVQKGLLNLFCGKLLLTETKTRLSICEEWSPLRGNTAF